VKASWVDMSDKPRYADYYYGGPYICVKNPDCDLPMRDFFHPITDDQRAKVEFDGTLDGERIVAPFGDSNELDDILGLLTVAQGYPESWSEDERTRFPTIQGILVEAIDRVATKIRLCKQVRRRSWFNLALEALQEAREYYSTGQYDEGRRAVQGADDLLRKGNKADKRKTAFIAGPGGDITKA
jgi:hypothetical protein